MEPAKNGLKFLYKIFIVITALFTGLTGVAGGCLFGINPTIDIGRYNIEVYTTEEGLPQSSILSVLQTMDGYLWMGTYEGVARFDGIRYGMRLDGKDPAELYAKTRAAGFGQEVKRRIILGTYVLSSGYYDAYYKKAQKVRTLIRNDFTEAFKTCDAVLAPVTTTPAYKKGEKTDDPLKMYLDDILTTPINLAGNCALSVPCGFASNGMPIGLQVIGDAFEEEKILKVGHAYEQSTEWHKKRPAL